MLKILEKKIADYFNRKYCIFLGSGGTSLYVIFKALGFEKGDTVLYPDITCETALNPSIYAGLKAVFSDIRLYDYNFDIEKTVLLSKTQNVKAIVATHIFGHSLDLSELKKKVSKDVIIIEDAAQSFGAKIDSSITGNMGDASIISFGKNKIIDCGGGGAVLTDSKEFYEKCCEIRKKINNDISARENLRKQFMLDYFSISKNANDSKDFITERDKLKLKYKDVYVFQADKELINTALNKIDNIDEIINKRIEISNKIYDFIKGNIDYITLPKIDGDKLLWRLSFIVKEGRDKLYDELINNGFKVTKFFKPLHKEYDLDENLFPSSNYFYQYIINLRLDINMNDINKLFKILSSIQR